jgi:hypothetical protein
LSIAILHTRTNYDPFLIMTLRCQGGEMTVDAPGQAVLERTAVLLTPDALEARFTIALPASGRTVLGQMAYTSIIDMLPQYVQQVRLGSLIHAYACTLLCGDLL